MMTTDTTSVIEHLVTVIQGITPEASPASPGFVRASGPTRTLRRGLPPGSGTALVRLFDLRSQGSDEIGIEAPAVKLVTVQLLLTIAYPSVPKLYGLTELHALEALIESDRHQIIDKVEAPGGLVGAGHQANTARQRTLDQADEQQWFQEIEIEALFYTTRKR